MSAWEALLGWLPAFALTQLVEVPLYRWAGASARVAFLASALTHPVVWFLFPLLPVGYLTMAVCAEGFAVLVEAGWLRRHGVRRGLAWALLANGASVVAGLASRALWGVP